MRFLAPLRDGDAQASLLAIVRNAWYSRVARLLLQQDAVARVRDAPDELPIDFREVIVLREAPCSGRLVASPITISATRSPAASTSTPEPGCRRRLATAQVSSRETARITSH